MIKKTASILILALCTTLTSCLVPLEHPRADLPLDGWKSGYYRHNSWFEDVRLGHSRRWYERGSLVRYVPLNEFVKSWTRLVSVEFWEDSEYTPKGFTKKRMEELGSTCPEVSWKVISESDLQILYEWRIVNCDDEPDTYGIEKTMQGNDGLHRVSYLERTDKLNEFRREKWIRIFEAAFLQKEDERVVVREEPFE